MLLEFQLDWIKIVDFLLVAKFKACLLFFTHTLPYRRYLNPTQSSSNTTPVKN